MHQAHGAGAAAAVSMWRGCVQGITLDLGAAAIARKALELPAYLLQLLLVQLA